MQVKANIVHLKDVPVGFSCGYGRKFIAQRPSRIATIALGYADGYPRPYSAQAKVIVNGVVCPIAGNICMDQCMVDVTEIEAEEFDRVTLLGQDGKDAVTADELGRLSGRFPYELVCDISKRVPRVYVDA